MSFKIRSWQFGTVQGVHVIGTGTHRPCFWSGSGFGIRIQEGKNDPTNIEKSKEFSCFEVLDVLFWGLKASPSLDILYGGLAMNKLQFIKNFFTDVNFFKFLVIKTLGPDRYSGFSLKWLIRIWTQWIRIGNTAHMYSIWVPTYCICQRRSCESV